MDLELTEKNTVRFLKAYTITTQPSSIHICSFLRGIAYMELYNFLWNYLMIDISLPVPVLPSSDPHEELVNRILQEQFFLFLVFMSSFSSHFTDYASVHTYIYRSCIEFVFFIQLGDFRTIARRLSLRDKCLNDYRYSDDSICDSSLIFCYLLDFAGM
jgi:hypothetical protein